MALIGTARIRVSADTTGFQAQIAAAVAKLQTFESIAKRGDLKDLFTVDPKSFKQLAKEADKTYESVNGLITKSYVIQAAISALVPVLAQAAAGLFAFGSQALAAGPALVVLPAAFTAIAQAAITAKLALGGVFKAVGELGKAKTGSVSQLPSKLAALASAQQRVDKAQRSLNDAYRTAAERLQQLGFDSEDAAIAQKRAAIELEKARTTLQRVQDLPPNATARREAELAFAEADLNYRRSIDRNKDLQDETKRATNEGKWSAEEQVNNSREVLDAQAELKNSLNSLAKAQLDLNKAQSGSGGLTEFNKLSKSAQEFAKYIVSLKPEIQKLKDAAGEKLFAPLQESVSNLVDNFFPKLIPLLRETGDAFGKTALDFSKAVTEADNLKNFQTIGKTNIDVIEKLGKVIGNLYSAFLSIISAAGPLVKRFSDWVVTLTDGWKAAAEVKNKTGALTDTFKQAGDIASQLGDIIGNLIGGLINMGKAASGPGSGGQMIFDSLDRNTKKFKKWSETVLKDGSLENYFKESSNGFLKLGGIIGKIFKIIFKSATQAGTGEFLDSVSRAVDTLGVAFTNISGSAPAFGKFIEGMARFIAVFSESGSIIAFFKTLTTAVNIAASIFENEFVAKVFKAMAAIHGAKLAVLLIKKALTTLALYILGMIRQVLKPLIGVFRVLTSGFGLTSAAAIGVIAAVIALGVALIGAWKHSKKFRDSLAELGGKVLTSLSNAFSSIKVTFDKAFSGIFGKGVKLGDVFRGLGDALAKYVVPVFEYVLPKSIQMLSTVIQGLIKIVAGLIKIFMGVFKMIRGIFRLFTGDFDGFLDSFSVGVKDTFGGIGQIISGTLGPIFDSVKSIFGPVFSFISAALSPIIDLFKEIGKIIGVVFYVTGLVAFTAFGIVVAETWRKLKDVGVAIWQNVIYPLSKSLLPVAKKVFGFMTSAVKIVFTVLKTIAGISIFLLIKGFKILSTVIKTVFNGKIFTIFAKVFMFAFKGIIAYYKFAFKVIFAVFNAVWPLIQAGVKLFAKIFVFEVKVIVAFWKFAFKAVLAVFNAVWPLIWGGIQFAWRNVIKPVFGLILAYWTFVFNAVRAVFDAVWPYIWKGIQFAWNNVIKPVFKLIFSVWQTVFNAIRTVFDAVWPYIWKGIQFAWNSVIKPVFGFVLAYWKVVFGAILTVFNSVWPLIWGGIQFAWNSIIKPVFDFILTHWTSIFSGVLSVFTTAWSLITGAIPFAWNNIIKPVIGAIGSAFGAVWGGVQTAFSTVWNGIKSAFTNFPDFVRGVFNRVIKIMNGLLHGIANAFMFIPKLIGKMWSGIIGLFEKGVNLLIKGFNNTLGGKSFKLPGFLGGGKFGFDKIPELGSGQKLDVEQVVTGGFRDIPGLARGGTVLPRAGGTLVNVAEAGRAERIEPLDSDGLSKRDRAMIAVLSGAGGGMTINVHPSPGMNEVELASLVSRQIAFQMRRGAA